MERAVRDGNRHKTLRLSDLPIGEWYALEDLLADRDGQAIRDITHVMYLHRDLLTPLQQEMCYLHYDLGYSKKRIAREQHMAPLRVSREIKAALERVIKHGLEMRKGEDMGGPWTGGKGDKDRTTNKKQYDANHKAIFGEKKFHGKKNGRKRGRSRKG